MNNYDGDEIINIGTGFDYSIKEFISILEEVTNYHGEITWDTSKPDGTMEKELTSPDSKILCLASHLDLSKMDLKKH